MPRRELRDHLVAIPHVVIPDASLTKRPPIAFRHLVEPTSLQVLLEAFDWFIGAVRGGGDPGGDPGGDQCVGFGR